MDHIKVRFNLIKWGTIFAALAFPVAVYLITRKILDLRLVTVFLWVAAAFACSTFVLYRSDKYLNDGFSRFYGRGCTWDYLCATFAVEKKPQLLAKEWNGYGYLERQDTLFEIEAGVTEIGLYLNIVALGRLLVPWSDVKALSRERLHGKNKVEELVSINFGDPDISIAIPWNADLNDLVPAHVPISTKSLA